MKPRLTKKVVEALSEASAHLQQELDNDEFQMQFGDDELHDQVEIAVKYLDRLYQWHKRQKRQ